MPKPYPTQAAAQAALDAARASGRIDSGQTHSPNGTHWYAHGRRGTLSFCL